MKKTKYIYVEWVDSTCSKNGWVHKDDIDEMSKNASKIYKTIGIFVKESNGILMLANSINPWSNYYEGVNSIPLVAIKKRKYIKI